jgi:hypothetical protein
MTHHHLRLTYFDERAGADICLAVNEWAFDEKARLVSTRNKEGLPVEYVAVENLVSWAIMPSPDYCREERVSKEPLVCFTPGCERLAWGIVSAEEDILDALAPRRCVVCCDAVGSAISTYLNHRKVVPS